jgi:hypothetical protein
VIYLAITAEMKTLTINEETFEVVDDKARKQIEQVTENMANARIGQVTLLASAWSGSGNLFSQVVNIDTVTANSQVDLTPSVDQLVSFYEKDLTLVTENENGVVTVYAIGQKPQNNYTIQVTITEVHYE